MTMEMACTSSVRPFNVPNDAGVGVFSFTSIMTNLDQIRKHTINRTHPNTDLRERYAAFQTGLAEDQFCCLGASGLPCSQGYSGSSIRCGGSSRLDSCVSCPQLTCSAVSYVTASWFLLWDDWCNPFRYW